MREDAVRSILPPWPHQQKGKIIMENENTVRTVNGSGQQPTDAQIRETETAASVPVVPEEDAPEPAPEQYTETAAIEKGCHPQKVKPVTALQIFPETLEEAGVAEKGHTGFLKIYEKFLTVLVIGFAYIHMFAMTFYYVLNTSIIKKTERITATALSAAVIIYIIISILFYHWNLKRIRDFIHGLINYEQLYLVCLVIWFFISCLVNAGFSSARYLNKNETDLINVFCNAFVLFPLAKILPKPKTRKIIEWGFFLLLFSYSVYSVYGLRRFFLLDFDKKIRIDSDRFALRLGCHYNITGAIAFLMLIICLYFLPHRNKMLKIVSIMLIPVHLFVCHLSNSRTIFVTGMMILPLYAFFFVQGRCEQKGFRFRLMTGFIAAIIVFGIFWFTRPLPFYLFEKVSHMSTVVPGESEGSRLPVKSIRSLSSIDGRKLVWLASLKTMMNNPKTFFFGVTPYSVQSSLTKIGEYPGKSYHAHNIILQIGVSFGVPAMIAFCIYLFRICFKTLRFLFSKRNKPFPGWFVLPVMIFSLVIPGITEPYIVNSIIMSSVFTLVSGWELNLE